MTSPRLRLIARQPQHFRLYSVAMPLYDLDVRRLSLETGPLSAEDRLMLTTHIFTPNKETALTNYSLSPPTLYAVVARRRWAGAGGCYDRK